VTGLAIKYGAISCTEFKQDVSVSEAENEAFIRHEEKKIQAVQGRGGLYLCFKVKNTLFKELQELILSCAAGRSATLAYK